MSVMRVCEYNVHKPMTFSIHVVSVCLLFIMFEQINDDNVI